VVKGPVRKEGGVRIELKDLGKKSKMEVSAVDGKGRVQTFFKKLRKKRAARKTGARLVMSTGEVD